MKRHRIPKWKLKWHMSAYKFPYVAKPFKGCWAYEIQTGPFIWQCRFELGYRGRFHLKKWEVSIGLVSVWWDTNWWWEVSRPWRRYKRR